jgi:phage portal protein BeeE
MSIWDRTRDFLLGPVVEKTLSLPDETPVQLLQRMGGTTRTIPYRIPTVRRALSVPANLRAVSLISSTAGMLSMEGYQRGRLMDEPPQIIIRPDPYETPAAFYSGSAANMAKYGEIVWWIAQTDAAGFATSLVVVPLPELQVDENQNNRLMPRYTWGTKTGTRYSGANREGRFVHIKYPGTEPFALRGSGPLQICGAAVSVSVEAQDWAADFYADGGNPSLLIKHAATLSGERLDPETYLPDDTNGLNEAERLRQEFMSKAHNVPRVIDQNIESVEYLQPGERGAQMLESRQHQNGEAARMFGVPGSLLEYQAQGSSLTYQNLEGEFTKFIRVCEQPLYLEPMEQAMSDLLPRSIAARFNVDGFLRADIKTRFDVHKVAIETGIYGPEYAQQVEGIAPGDVEFQPIPFSPPAAVPVAIKAASTEMRDVRCPTCQRLVARAAGPIEGWCRHCKQTVAA